MNPGASGTPDVHGSALPEGQPSGVPEGYAVVDKPAGLTSHRLLADIGRTLEARTGAPVKLGHAGTLDSFATGVLICLFGRYTRLSDFFMGAGKGYEAVVAFGAETDTLDPSGSVVAEGPPPDRAALEAALPRFRGAIMQAPPAYSAVHVDGERAWERALRGEAVAPRERPVTVGELELLDYADGRARIRVSCSKGTYVRSLARDIALACGSRSHLAALRRTFSGPFRVEDAVAPDAFDASAIRCLTLADASGLGLAVESLAEPDAGAFAHGLPLFRVKAFKGREGDGRPVAAFGPGEAFLGIATGNSGAWRYAVVFEPRP